MFIQKEVLLKLNPVRKAISEGRLRFFKNGSYSYVPSKEYLDLKKGKKKKETEAYILKGAARRLNRLVQVMDKGKRVVRVTNNVIC